MIDEIDDQLNKIYLNIIDWFNWLNIRKTCVFEVGDSNDWLFGYIRILSSVFKSIFLNASY